MKDRSKTAIFCAVLAGVLIAKDPVYWMLIQGAVLILVGIRQVTKPK